MIHGKITNEQTKEYLSHLLDWILDVTKANLEIVNEFTDQEANTELWNQICQSRRILKRIIIATKGDKHRSALENEETLVSVNTIRSLKDLASRTTNLVLSKSREIIQRERGEGIYWYELAIAYEATIVLRSKNKVALAIDLANVCMEHKIEKFKSKSKPIRGLFSFNRNLIEEMSQLTQITDSNGDKKELYSAKDLLFRLSNRISRNSKSAASFGLNWNQDDSAIPLALVLDFIEVVSTKKMTIHESSVFHLEGLLRVSIYHSFWSNRTFKDATDLGILNVDSEEELNKLFMIYYLESFFENTFFRKSQIIRHQ